MNMRKLFASVLSMFLAATLILTSTSCSKTETSELLPFAEKTWSSAEIVERINNIGDVTIEKEYEIESIYIDYTSLTDKQRAEVSNYEVLDTARNEIAKLFNTEPKVGDRFNRSEILLGTYCFNYTGEESVRWLAEAGFDYATATSSDIEMLDYFDQYGIGAFIGAGYLGIPSWRGGVAIGPGEHIEPTFTIDYFRSCVENAVFDHPAMWGIELVDEPNTDDMPFIGQEVAVYNELNPDMLVYINLFPNGAQVMGSDTYYEHVQAYAANVNTDYISLDVYPMYETNEPTYGEDYFMLAYLATLKDIADVCRDNDRDMWAVLQAGAASKVERDYINLDQFRLQAYTALAYGAKAINWACWTNGWFEPNTNLVDLQGNRTPGYYEVQKINAEIKALSPVYMKYTNTDTCFIENPEFTIPRYEEWLRPRFDRVLADGLELDQDMFTNFSFNRDDTLIFAGSFVKNDGNGEALMITNITDFMYQDDNSPATMVSFSVKDENAEVVAYYPHGAVRLYPSADGVYSLEIENATGVFITVEHPEVVEISAE